VASLPQLGAGGGCAEEIRGEPGRGAAVLCVVRAYQVKRLAWVL
jgi:hypothetical protein